MSIAVTGASGQLGRLVADQLLATVEPGEVVLLTRNPASLADLADLGAEVRAADFGDPASLSAAFAGVERLLLISTDVVGDRLEGHRAAITAAVEAGVKHVVYTSVPEPVTENPAQVVPDHAGTEEALRASGIAWTMLRNNLYAEMQVPVVQQAIASGRLVTNGGTGAVAYVTRADIAAAAVGALTGSGHEGQAYDVTGPAAVTADEVAALAGELGGVPVEVVQVDDAAYTAGLVQAGLPEVVAGLLTSFGTATREGYLDTVTTVVQDLSGRAPTALRDVLAAG